MGVCAEDTAEKHHITREEQDEFALLSYARSASATENGTLAKEIVPVEVKSRRETVVIDTDEEYKNLNVDKVPTLRAVFKPEGGTGTCLAPREPLLCAPLPTMARHLLYIPCVVE